MTVSDTSASLLRRVRLHDRDAWNRLVDVYGPLVLRWCRNDGLDDHDASDVGQEVFADVARNIGRFRRDRPGDSFRKWLRAITRSKVVNVLRRRDEAAEGGTTHQQRMASIPSEDGPPTGEPREDEALEEAGVCRRVLAYLREQFPPHHWQAFWRTAIDGQKSNFVAEELGMTPENVRQAKRRVLKRLREELADLVEFT